MKTKCFRRLAAVLMALILMGSACCQTEEWDAFARQRFAARKVVDGAVVIARVFMEKAQEFLTEE